jgi:pimeloyl-ACP methyl ester carboxylesterase
MQTFFKLPIWILLFIQLLASCGTETNPFIGSWIGVAETQPFPELLFMYSDTSVMAKMYYHEVDLQETNSFSYKDNTITFSIVHKNFNGKFEGQIVSDTIKGNLYEDGKSYPCHFIRIQPEGPEKVSEFAGFYQIDDTHIVKIEPFPLDFTLTPLLITDFKTGKKRVAFPTGNQQYLSGNRQLAPYPIDLQIALTKDSLEIPLITLTDGAERMIGSRLQDLDKQIDFTAQNNGTALHASLHLPATEGPHPMVVIVHGAGNQSRQNFTLADFAALLPYYGIATLVYDKRGCGESEGDLQKASFETLASDVISLIEAANNYEQIDKAQVGLLGVDQAGFLMPLIAEENDQIKFIAGISTPATSMQAQELQACEMRMRGDGFTEEDIQEALSYQKTMFSYLAGNTDSLSFQKESDKLNDKMWGNYVTSFDNKEWINWWRKNYAFSSQKILAQLNLPMYFIFGGQDPLLKTEDHLNILTQLVPKERLTTKVYPKANHFMYEAGNRGDFQLTETRGYPSGIFYDLNEWMAQHLGLIHKQ